MNLVLLVACSKAPPTDAAPAPRPSYGQPCNPPSNGCFYLGDEYTGMPMVEVFDTSYRDGGADR